MPNPFQDFTWFDRAPQVTESGGTTTYTPGKGGGLGAIGRAMSGVAAPFLGDMDWAFKQAKLQQQAQQADMEFQQYLEKKNAPDPMTRMAELIQSMGGEIPVGTTFSGGGLTVPLNPKMTDQQTNIAGNSQQIIGSIDKAVSYIDKGVVDGLFNQARADLGNPLFVKGDLQDFTLELNNLKSIIPFTQGGKQLTPFESSLLFRLLNTSGKTRENAKSDLLRFKDKFKTLNDLSEKGIQGKKLQAAKDKVFSDLKGKTQQFTVDGTTYEIPEDKVAEFKKAKGLK